MKVLIITYYWPPAGGPGVQRVLKFAKYLPEYGWEPVILTVENGNHPAIDNGLLDEIPEGIKVYKTKTLEPFAIYNRIQGKEKDATIDTFTITKSGKSLKEKLGKLVRSYLFIPDARKGWKHYAVKAGLKIAQQENIDLIFSSSPPHSLQLIAKKIAKKTGLPWVADFRDPWSTAFWLGDEQKKGLPHKLNIRKEKSVFAQLDHFTTVSNGTMESYTKLHPHTKDNATLLYNGYDESDFDSLKSKKNEQFTIRYVGTLAQTQNPLSLFQALAQLKEKEPYIYNKITVEFWGKFDSTIAESSKGYNLESKVNFYGYVKHKKAVELMQTSDLLILSIPNDDSNGILTGKLYEYIATEKPIIGFGPQNCEAQQLVEENNFGKFAHDNTQALEILKEEFAHWENNEPKRETTEKEQFSRKALTQKLSEVFDKVLAQCK